MKTIKTIDEKHSSLEMADLNESEIFPYTMKHFGKTTAAAAVPSLITILTSFH
jgi:hypothetical protein